MDVCHIGIKFYREVLVLGNPPHFFRGQKLKVCYWAYTFFIQVPSKIRKIVTYIVGASLKGRS